MTMTDPTALVGFFAFDRDGGELGEIEGVYLGSEEPEWASVLMDGSFVIIPLLEADLYEDSLNVPFTSGDVAGAPFQQDELLEDLTEEQEGRLVAYYTDLQRVDIRETGTEVGSTATEQGRQVASTAKEQGQQVASTAKEQGQHVASTAKEQTQRVTSAAKEQGQQVLRTTADQAGDLVGTATEQAAEVAHQASIEARNLLEETRTRLEEQTAQGAHTLGENLSRLGDEAIALADGRPQDAPTVQGYVRRAGETMLDAADRAYGISDEVRTRGLGGLLTDVSSFARRRPGAFLLGTAVVGVVAGRAVRNAKHDDGGGAQPSVDAGRQASSRAGTRGGR